MAKKKGGGRVTPKQNKTLAESAPADVDAWWEWYERIRANPVTIKGKRPVRVGC